MDAEDERQSRLTDFLFTQKLMNEQFAYEATLTVDVVGMLQAEVRIQTMITIHRFIRVSGFKAQDQRRCSFSAFFNVLTG